jgi:hypothetical protein
MAQDEEHSPQGAEAGLRNIIPYTFATAIDLITGAAGDTIDPCCVDLLKCCKKYRSSSRTRLLRRQQPRDG